MKKTNAECQIVPFTKKAWEITANGIKEYSGKELAQFDVWGNKIIDFEPQKDSAHFEIGKDKNGNWDITILKKDNKFLNFLINTSRIHWKKDLELSFEGLPTEEKEAYAKKHKFDIAAPNLTADEIVEQKHNLVSKIFSIGYLAHTYKDRQRPWVVLATDKNKVDNGGTGKTLCYYPLKNLLNAVYLKGRGEKALEDHFVFNEVNKTTDIILIDDTTKHFRFEETLCYANGSMLVNKLGNHSVILKPEDVPKFIITSDFINIDKQASILRRLLHIEFSDYYHIKTEGIYDKTRMVSDDFDGKHLFAHFTDNDWNDYYNLCAQSLQFYLRTPEKINSTK